MNEDVIGLIPAAGRGVRLNLPYPKELYPIIRENRYKPVSQFILDSLVIARVRHIVLVVNETKHQLMGFFGDGHRFGCHISYVAQELRDGDNGSTSPGLAHALDSAYHLTRGKTVFFGMADTIIDPDDVFVRAHDSTTPEDDVTLILFPTEHPDKFGMVRLDDDCIVEEIVDKPQQTDLVDMWGCMIWQSQFTEHLHECVATRGMSDFAEIMNDGIVSGLRFRGVRMVDGSYADLGTYHEIMELDERLRQK